MTNSTGDVTRDAKSGIIYTEEFYDALKAMIDKRPRSCRGCGVVDGERKFLKNGSQRKLPAKVRPCLIDKNGPPNEASNVAMFCLRCRKPGPEWRTPERLKPKDLPQFNFPDPPLEFGPGASTTLSLEAEFPETASQRTERSNSRDTESRWLWAAQYRPSENSIRNEAS